MGPRVIGRSMENEGESQGLFEGMVAVEKWKGTHSLGSPFPGRDKVSKML